MKSAGKFNSRWTYLAFSSLLQTSQSSWQVCIYVIVSAILEEPFSQLKVEGICIKNGVFIHPMLLSLLLFLLFTISHYEQTQLLNHLRQEGTQINQNLQDLTPLSQGS